MRTLAVFKRLVFAGLGLNILGLLLPWGKEYYLPVLGVGQGYLLGIELLLGTQVIVGCIITAVFWTIFQAIYRIINTYVKKINSMPHILDRNGSRSCLVFRKTMFASNMEHVNPIKAMPIPAITSLT
jgi:hypothetical protein